MRLKVNGWQTTRINRLQALSMRKGSNIRSRCGVRKKNWIKMRAEEEGVPGVCEWLGWLISARKKMAFWADQLRMISVFARKSMWGGEQMAEKKPWAINSPFSGMWASMQFCVKLYIWMNCQQKILPCKKPHWCVEVLKIKMRKKLIVNNLQLNLERSTLQGLFAIPG